MRCSSGDAVSQVFSVYGHRTFILKTRWFQSQKVKKHTHTSRVQPRASIQHPLQHTVSFQPGTPEQGLETLAHGPNQPPPVFVNCVLLAHGHSQALSAVWGCFCAARQSWVAAAEMVWPAKPKLLTDPQQHFPADVCCLLCYSLPYLSDQWAWNHRPKVACATRKHCSSSKA